MKASRSYSETPRLVGLLWASDQPVAKTSTWQHTTLTLGRHPCPSGIRTAIPASERSQTHASDCATTGIRVPTFTLRRHVYVKYSNFYPGTWINVHIFRRFYFKNRPSLEANSSAADQGIPPHFMEPENSSSATCSHTEQHQSILHQHCELFTSRHDLASQDTPIFNNPHSRPATTSIPTWYVGHLESKERLRIQPAQLFNL